MGRREWVGRFTGRPASPFQICKLTVSIQPTFTLALINVIPPYKRSLIRGGFFQVTSLVGDGM
jgi:hypothetical protein